MPYPGLDNFKTELVYRTLGGASSKERIGAGFMNKRGIFADNVNFDFPHYVIVYVLRGKGEYVDSSGQRYNLREGSYFQRIPGHQHSNYIDPDSDWAECFMQVGSETASILGKTRIISKSIVGNIPIDALMLNKIWEFKEKLKNTEEERLPDCLIELLALINEFFKMETYNELRRKSISIIEKACQYLNKNLEQRTNLEEFCGKQGWGYEKFRKDFQARMGISPGKYRIRRRLDVSCQMLNNPDYTISEIAEKLGYPSPYEFSAQFKKFLGVSPRYYRSGG